MKDEVFCCLVDKMLNETVNSHKGVPRIFFRILSSDHLTKEHPEPWIQDPGYQHFKSWHILVQKTQIEERMPD